MYIRKLIFSLTTEITIFKVKTWSLLPKITYKIDSQVPKSQIQHSCV